METQSEKSKNWEITQETWPNFSINKCQWGGDEEELIDCNRLKGYSNQAQSVDLAWIPIPTNQV